MARPRLPTAVLEARGAYKQNPQRRRQREGEPVVDTPLGAPPAQVRKDKALFGAWQLICATAPERVLTSADPLIVEMCARLWVEFVEDSLNMDTSRIKTLHSLLESLGMTPVGRSKINVPKAPKDKRGNAFSQLDS